MRPAGRVFEVPALITEHLQFFLHNDFSKAFQRSRISGKIGLNLCEPGGKKKNQKKEERTAEQIEKRKKYGKTVNKQKERDK